MNEQELLKRAVTLTAAANQLKLAERLIENVEYARINKDQFSVNHQLQSGVLEDIGEVISDIRNTIQDVSNDICPD
ncbi:hypothetical protein OMY_01400 [Enterococcus sulfureus ATCC 49903]|uniref:Uncharacterized protein n=1 Tax=Enterococcus sulfureus ATCC 49903 TaxID=1140003 RepID=S0KR86_9ENTE|nr:hypothetical protein [Enterococcus sulfureus]EOT47147.1 hypothetical protein OMY_01400 [Enterococcus sulfureus ATCC 49903]EOT83558.1 hypothetical protein I573_01280 [Enterococcus sulfureus ATCC 49903]